LSEISASTGFPFCGAVGEVGVMRMVGARAATAAGGLFSLGLDSPSSFCVRPQENTKEDSEWKCESRTHSRLRSHGRQLRCLLLHLLEAAAQLRLAALVLLLRQDLHALHQRLHTDAVLLRQLLRRGCESIKLVKE